MSGTRLHSFREGDRSEYLAQYLLSAVGIATPVPRQEDIGVDFECSIAEGESGLLRFDSPFQISIKSEVTEIAFGGIHGGKWKEQDIRWLQKIRIPLLVGIVSKADLTMDIFSTTALRLAHARMPINPTEIVLAPRFVGDPTGHVTNPIESAITSKPWGASDGKSYRVDLGPAIVQINARGVQEPAHRKDVKRKLRNIIELEWQNIVFARLGVPYFYWFRNRSQHGDLEFAYGCGPAQNPDAVAGALAPALATLAMGNNGGSPLGLGAKEFIRLVDARELPPEVRAALI